MCGGGGVALGEIPDEVVIAVRLSEVENLAKPQVVAQESNQKKINLLRSAFLCNCFIILSDGIQIFAVINKYVTFTLKI